MCICSSSYVLLIIATCLDTYIIIGTEKSVKVINNILLSYIIPYIHTKLEKNLNTHSYGTTHIQVYKQTCVMRRASRNFEDNSHVGLVRHEEYTARERLLMSLKYS